MATDIRAAIILQAKHVVSKSDPVFSIFENRDTISKSRVISMSWIYIMWLWNFFRTIASISKPHIGQ